MSMETRKHKLSVQQSITITRYKIDILFTDSDIWSESLVGLISGTHKEET